MSGWMEILDSRHALMQKNYRGLDVENAVVAIRDSIAADNSEVVFFRMQSRQERLRICPPTTARRRTMVGGSMQALVPERLG